MESSTVTPAAGRGVDAPTLNEALRRTAANHPDIVAVRWPDDSVALTWSQLQSRVDALAGGLAKLGIGRGDAVAIDIALSTMIARTLGLLAPEARPHGLDSVTTACWTFGPATWGCGWKAPTWSDRSGSSTAS